MDQPAKFAETAAMLADASRAAMLLTLLDGRAYTATELARAADITPQTASFHLDKMLKSSFLEAMRQGRHRYFRLAGTDVAQALESILTLQHAPLPHKISSSCPADMRDARSCYDHIAGRMGVRLFRSISAKGWTEQAAGHLAVNKAAMDFLDELDIKPREFPIDSRQCLDWSERDYHFAGEFGKAMLRGMLEKRWLLRTGSRALVPTERGLRRLAFWGL
jgi:DNA-binding transcriptional ArsR family regulator